jgi:polyisoprenoid-binding protein YceI
MGMNKARVTGDLTLRGVTKPVTLVVTFNGAGVNPATRTYTVGFSAEGTISRSQFGVAAFSPAIGEEVALTISGEFNPVAPAGSQGTSGASGSR